MLAEKPVFNGWYLSLKTVTWKTHKPAYITLIVYKYVVAITDSLYSGQPFSLAVLNK